MPTSSQPSPRVSGVTRRWEVSPLGQAWATGRRSVSLSWRPHNELLRNQGVEVGMLTCEQHAGAGRDQAHRRCSRVYYAAAAPYASTCAPPTMGKRPPPPHGERWCLLRQGQQ